MKRRIVAMIALFTLTLSIFPFNIPKVKAEPNPTVYVFDLEVFIGNLPNAKAQYDYLKLAAVLQGLVNREQPQIYFLYETNYVAKGRGVSSMDQYWYDKLNEAGGYLSTFPKDTTIEPTLEGFNQLLALFGSYYNGFVLWDDSVPSTSNVASTICGVEDLLPVRYVSNVGSLYHDLFIKTGHAFDPTTDIKKSLVDKFTGNGTIPDSATISTGSAKNDAYIWAKEQYLDKGLTSNSIMTYNLDGYLKDSEISHERDGEFVSAKLPEKMNPGQSVAVEITVKNTGNLTWSKAAMYRLASKGALNSFTAENPEFGGEQLGITSSFRIFLDESNSIETDEEFVFKFSIIAPSEIGKKKLNLGLVQDGVTWFGNELNVDIEVTNDAVAPGISERVKSTGSFPGLYNRGLTNADYFIANKAFFFDLSPDETSYPIDDRDQPLGTDTDTLKKILHAQTIRANNKIFSISGFVPWDTKYTTIADPEANLDPVPCEWKMVDIFSMYGAEADPDALGIVGIANASVFASVPLEESYSQPNDKGENSTVEYDKDTKYITLYMGDYDCAAWTSGILPTAWDDARRGEMPLAWPVNGSLSNRVPHVYDHLYKTASENDYFVAGDNGTGYLNPMWLLEENRPTGFPDLIDEWKNHNIASNRRFDIDITGFLIGGNIPFIPERVQQAYSEMTPAGVAYLGGVDHDIYNEVPFMHYSDLGVIDLTNIDTGVNNLNEILKTKKQFHMVRSVITMPSALFDTINKYKEVYPDVKIEVVDPYTLMRLFKEEGGEKPSVADVTYTSPYSNSEVITDGVVSENEWAGAEEMVVSQEDEIVKKHGNVWGNFTGVSDLTSKYKIKWDDENLYLLEERTDNALNLTESGENPTYIVDSSMLFLDLKNTKNGAAYTNGAYSIYYTPKGLDGNPRAFLRGNDVTVPMPEAVIASTLIDGGYVVEVAIPWSSFKETAGSPPKNDLRIGMTVLAIDNDGDSAFKGQIMWAGQGDEKSGWADMIFAGKPVDAVIPNIKAQPKSITVKLGGVATFTVDAESTEELSYQWYFGDIAIENAVSATLSIENVTEEDAGGYHVRVYSDNGEVLSNVVLLTVENESETTTEQSTTISTTGTKTSPKTGNSSFGFLAAILLLIASLFGVQRFFKRKIKAK